MASLDWDSIFGKFDFASKMLFFLTLPFHVIDNATMRLPFKPYYRLKGTYLKIDVKLEYFLGEIGHVTIM